MGKGGNADNSGVQMAQASAQAAVMAYQIGEQQLQWAKQVWNQEQPLINQSEQTSIQLAQQEMAASQQMQAFSKEQMDMWNQYYAPLQESYVQQAENWASPANLALVTGQAQAGVAEQAQQGLNTAAEQLQSYGVNPSAGRFAGLLTGASATAGAAEAAAGTTAGQNLRLQQLALEQGAINTGQGVANTAGQLTNAATGASQAGTTAAGTTGSTAQSNIATGSSAQTAAANWYNTGATNMGVYTNAVNAYNQAQLGYAQLGAQQASGLGTIAGGLLGTKGISSLFGLQKGGPIWKFQDAGVVPGQAPGQAPQQGIPQQNMPVPTGGTPGGFVPHHASPSGGQIEDDVDAKLTAGEFVMPKDVSQWVGQKAMVTQIDKARQEMQMFGQRNDIGGEPVQGIPQSQPTFVSRPGQQQSVGPPGQPMQQNQQPPGQPQQGQPMMPQMQQPQGPRPSPSGYNQSSGIPLPA